MPFQSEKQRRYLWANEPKIARDWADTYGSRIEKNTGGISQLVKSGPGRPGYAGPAGGASAGGDYGGDVNPNQEYAGRAYRDQSYASKESIEKGDKKLADAKAIAILADDKKEAKVEKFRHKNINSFFKNNKTRDFFLNKVLSSNKKYGDTFYGLSENDQEEEYQNYLKQRAGGNIDAYGRDINPNFSGDGIRYPQGIHPGTGTEQITTEVIKEPISDFQKSLTGTVGTPGYYVGNDPTASNLAWGKEFGADPRTMGQTSWAANGGRIPAAFGGIMDSSTGRRAYGFGSIFKKIGRAAKKVLKSPIAKGALMAGIGFGIPGTSFGGLFGRGAGSMFGQASGMLPASWKNKLLMKKLGEDALGKAIYTGKGAGLDWGKLGIMGAGALPFLMGGQEEDEDEGFDYMGAKNAYADEIKRIKAGAMAGSLDPNEFSYLGVKDGGRIGLYSGGQSTPSDYTMEDARKTTTQDKMGGITDAMKRADLYRQGDVGQMYMANGGSADAKLLARVQELQDEGLDYNSAMAQALKELSKGKAQGGRIGAEEGGLMDLGGMEKDYRNDGGFVPLGGEEKADDVPARLSKNEFVFTADAVRGAGGGDIDKGAEIMENIMKNLEQGGQISEETQGLSGAQEMFGVSERLSEVV